MGLDVLLYLGIYENLVPRGVHLEANCVLECNHRTLNALEKLELVKTKVYRVCGMPFRDSRTSAAGCPACGEAMCPDGLSRPLDASTATPRPCRLLDREHTI